MKPKLVLHYFVQPIIKLRMSVKQEQKEVPKFNSPKNRNSSVFNTGPHLTSLKDSLSSLFGSFEEKKYTFFMV